MTFQEFINEPFIQGYFSAIILFFVLSGDYRDFSYKCSCFLKAFFYYIFWKERKNGK